MKPDELTYVINVVLINGTMRDAKFHGWKANRKHGQPLTNADKRNIVLEILEDEEAKTWSDSHIAKEFSFSPTFVGVVRKSLSTVDSEIPAERTFVNKHGQVKAMKTKSIGNAKPAPAADAQTPADTQQPQRAISPLRLSWQALQPIPRPRLLM